ncbi:DnaJ sub C member 7 [Nowakowskiella sp. JEL0407]|nr:DnaJ sub C member 7 [Nowakowskiella sp. JEL0407]
MGKKKNFNKSKNVNAAQAVSESSNTNSAQNLPNHTNSDKVAPTSKDTGSTGGFEQNYKGKITPEKFFEKYVCTRTPCIFTSALTDPEYNAKKWTTPTESPSSSKVSPFEYLVKKAGNEIVQVEKMVDNGFGSGLKREVMLFGEFVEEMEKGNGSLYLTTQYGLNEMGDNDDVSEEEDDDDDDDEDDSGFTLSLDSLNQHIASKNSSSSEPLLELPDDYEESDLDEDFEFDENDDYDSDESNESDGNLVPETEKERDIADDFLSFCQQPLSALINDFPIRPELLGNLIPQQVNLWMGSAPESEQNKKGTSSGLHHDFADNLYILLKGRKQFIIFSPIDAGKLYTEGKIAKVHANGLITYWPEDMVESDFSTDILPDDASESEKQDLIASHRESMEASFPRADGAYLIDVADYKVRETEQRLRTLIARRARLKEIKAAKKEKDEAVRYYMEISSKLQSSEEIESDDELIFGNGDDEDSDDKTATNGSDTNGKHSESSLLKGKFKVEYNEDEESDDEESEDEVKPPPPSFSKIPVSVLKEETPADEFPLLRDAVKAVCEIKEGEMLYLPAGWFHEVTSLGLKNSKEPIDRVHMALSYWMHPPTQVRFEKPYEDSYWEDMWDPIEVEIEKMKKDLALIESMDDDDEEDELTDEEATKESDGDDVYADEKAASDAIRMMVGGLDRQALMESLKQFIAKRSREDDDDEDDNEDVTERAQEDRIVKIRRAMQRKRRLVAGWRAAKVHLGLGQFEVRDA